MESENRKKKWKRSMRAGEEEERLRFRVAGI